MDKSLFFVSSGRTGTHFLQSFFESKIPNCLSLWEPKPAFQRRGFEMVNRDYTLYEKIYFKSFRMARTLGKNINYYIEANNCLFSCIPLIRDTFPNSKIVHIVRDGRDVVKSYMNSFKRYAKDPWGKKELNPGHFGSDPFEEEWGRMSPIAKMSWYWLRTNEVIESDSPDLIVSFEEMFSSPHEPMKNILEYFPEVNLDQKDLNSAFNQEEASSSISYVPKWENWPQIWKNQFKSICKEKMLEYGYTC